MRVIAVFNRDGGTFRTTDMDAFAAHAREVFDAHHHELDVRLVAGSALVAALEAAAAEGDMLLAGGGDGTVSAAAAIAWRQQVPLGVIPAGTMNLFARSLQVPLDIGQALAAIAGGEIRAIDIATANGRPFIHQFSVGIHAKLVKLRETLSYRGRIGKIVASTRAFVGAVANAPNFEADMLMPTGVERRSTAGISVSNNPLEGPLPHAQRLDAGVLGIYVIAPLTIPVVAKLCWGVVRGHWKTLPEINERAAREVTIRFPGRKKGAVAAIDGELVTLPRAVEIRIHPGALKVVMPRPADTSPAATAGAASLDLAPA